jgi:cyclophilin family peptidyl-prolyl cis-trans isomerase
LNRGLRTLRGLAATTAIVALPAIAAAQPGGVVPATRLAILQAEERRAATPADLLTLRSGIRSRDPQTAILAIRAVGRLERPPLVTDLIPALRFALPEVRAEAANAIGQAAQGWNAAQRPFGTPDIGSMLATLIAHLDDEEQPSVRAALCESIGRLPYQDANDVARAEAALVEMADRSAGVPDRLGVAKGLEALVRRQHDRRAPSDRAVAALLTLAGIDEDDDANGKPERLRDARIRRLALEALLIARAIDEALVVRAATDADPQVRRLAMRGAAISGKGTGVLARGLQDTAAMVRLDALRGFATRHDDGACATFVAAASDAELAVALAALDQLAACGGDLAAVDLLVATVNDLSRAGAGRGWHRAARAIVALAAASPDRAGAALGQFAGSTRWELRGYAARAATTLRQRELLRTLAADAHDNVVEAAIEGLSKVAGHQEDSVYIQALSRSGYQAIRAAALALDETPGSDAAIPALKAAWTRLTEENHANSSDTRAAVAATLTRLGAAPPAAKAPGRGGESALSTAALRRLAAPRARVTIRDLGVFEFALFTSEAPSTVLRFAALAESGYYNGLTFHRVVPNFVVQGGSPAANEFVGAADFMRDEVGLWPHVRGAVGISTRGRDTGDAQFFVDLVDNPRFDHEYTVFGQLLNGIEVVDRILEGDVIERIEIMP